MMKKTLFLLILLIGPLKNILIHTAPEANDFVFIEGGLFQMGCDQSIKDCRKIESPQHLVAVEGFLLSRYEVTQEEYESVMNSNPSIRKSCERCPVNRVSWYDALTFSNRKSELEGLVPYYELDGNEVRINESSNGYRLPTEAEWEYVARLGAPESQHDLQVSKSWVAQTSKKKTQSVGLSTPNALGIYDLYGNAWEWCWDLFDKYDSKPSDPIDHIGKGQTRVMRGGSYLTDGKIIKPWFRSRAGSAERKADFGIRLARNVN